MKPATDIFWLSFGLVMGVFLGGSIFFGLYYQAPQLHGPKQESHSSQPHAPAEGQPSGSHASPFFVQVIPTPKTAEERAQEAEDREEKKAAERDLVRWTLALFLATVGLILATSVLGYFGFHQARDMKDSISVARGSANAAGRSADVAEQSLVSTQRAFVFMRGFNGIALTDQEQKVAIWKIWPVWENSGTTPSRQLFNHVSWMPIEGDIPADFSFPDIWSPGISTEQTRLFLGPKASINGQSVAIPIGHLLEVVAGKKRVFVWGWAEYDDVFPHTPPHRTEFCIELIVVSDPEVANFNHLSAALYTRHNGAEEECHHTARPAAKRFLPIV
jgi:hypothetical protein